MVCDTDQETPSECAQKILHKLEHLGYLPLLHKNSTNGDGAYTDDEEELVRQSLEALGYM